MAAAQAAWSPAIAASGLWAAAAMARRRWWRLHPEERRRLARPVISVGNLRVGGSGKTPMVARLASILLEMGERPAILSRGYARRDAPPGAVVVSDGSRVIAGLDRAGDEPLMLARELPGVAVVVCPDRFLAGSLAERRLAATVHLLDDGFQHFPLARDADLLLVSADDVAGGRTLPAGRLREPLEAAGDADAIAVTDGGAELADRIGARLGVGPVFLATRREQAVRMAGTGAEPRRRAITPSEAGPVVAFAGIARPERFFAALREGGWEVAAERRFGDHHRYRRDEVEAIGAWAASSGASMAVTTEKDLVRLLPLAPLPFALAAGGVEMAVEPAGLFRAWIESVLAASRARTGRGRGGDRAGAGGAGDGGWPPGGWAEGM